MKTRITIMIAAVLVVSGAVKGLADQTGKKALFTVDFQQGKTLRYEFVTTRDITTEWKSKSEKTISGSSKVDKSSERLELVMAYEPNKVDLFGLTKVKATCESVKVRRTGEGERQFEDAVLTMKGKSFTFTVDARGKVIDKSQLDALLKKLGEAAFVQGQKMRIKEPDMILDVVATQWFLWDAISSIKNPWDGVAVGQSWESVLSVPTPMIMRQARDVVYTLEDVNEVNGNEIAIIGSKYSLAKKVPTGWPVPYMGSFQMRGKYGFLRGYEMHSLEGSGTEIFNVDKGQIEGYQQNMKYSVQASAMTLATTDMKIDQKITMKLLKD